MWWCDDGAAVLVSPRPRNRPSGAIGAMPCSASSGSSFFGSDSANNGRSGGRAADGIGETIATLGPGDMSPRRRCRGRLEVLGLGESRLTDDDDGGGALSRLTATLSASHDFSSSPSCEEFIGHHLINYTYYWISH